MLLDIKIALISRLEPCSEYAQSVTRSPLLVLDSKYDSLLVGGRW